MFPGRFAAEQGVFAGVVVERVDADRLSAGRGGG